MNEQKSNQLRSQLPSIAAEMHFAIETAIEDLRRTAKSAGPSEAEQNWKKGIEDALKFMRLAEESKCKFTRWMLDVVAMEPDKCGLTRDERETVLGRG